MATLAYTVPRSGEGFWNTMLILRRTRIFSRSWILVTLVPSIRILPDFGRSSMSIRRKIVVFPEPLGPIKVKISPSLTENDTSFRTRFSPKFTTTCSNSITISPLLDQEEESGNKQSYEQEYYTQCDGEWEVTYRGLKCNCSSQYPRITTDIPADHHLSLIHISEPTRLGMISYAVFCLKKK